uniref:K Homology domain-containing protein n=1 Tax=Branchiostoma floridae TaxID=7739 RepID=C3Y172_BRAFL|eukprot:XP_002609602.1 hypothetical protein BRAFLDRAFT_87823 [Branchiostoma floridae]
MAQEEVGEETSKYLPQLLAEKDSLDPSFVHASRLIEEEISKLEKDDKSKEPPKYKEVHTDKPYRILERVLIPIKEYPKFNFVGKLLGPKGNSLKRLQEETRTKMSILGRGSMRDKKKEEELRESKDPKYVHLNDELHVLVEAFGQVADAHQRIAHGVAEVKKFLVPTHNDEIAQQQMEEMQYVGGDANGGMTSPRGRGRGRGGPGGPMSRGGRGGARGAPAGRGAPPGRGAPAPAGRGGPPGRGGPGLRGAPSYRGSGRGGMDSSMGGGYGQESTGDYGGGQGFRSSSRGGGYNQHSTQDYGYEESSYDQGYNQGYEQGYGGGSSGGGGYSETQSYDYGHGASSDSYGGDYGGDYGSSSADRWGGSGGAGSLSGGPTRLKAPGPRSLKGAYRDHPYGGGGSGGY